jgi:Xaa-Pro aminopeptidase
VTLDFGIIHKGYCSDMTRTVYLGRPTAKERDTYEAVLEAQEAGVGAVRGERAAGMWTRQPAAYCARRDWPRHFTHSTGHGVGLEIHEPPRIGAGQTTRLLPGMVVTIEPGFIWRVSSASALKIWWLLHEPAVRC